MAEFPLHQLIQVRQLRLQAAERVLHEKQARVAELEAELQLLEATISRISDERALVWEGKLKAACSQSAVTTMSRMELRIELLQEQLQKLGEQRQTLLQSLDTAEQELAAALQEYHRIEAKCTALDQQYEHWQHQQQLQSYQAEDQAAEELAGRRLRSSNTVSGYETH